MPIIKPLSVLLGMIACTSWLPLVQATSLQEVITHTLQSNPEVQAARKQLESRKSEIRVARAGYLPVLDAELGIGREGTNNPSTGNEDVTLTREEASLRLRQSIFDGSATRSEVDRQKARYHSALYNTIAVEETTALRVAEVYINVLRASELLQLLKASEDEHQNIYDQMALRRKAGVGSQADLDQIAARLALSRSNRVVGENNLDDAVSNFYGVVGYLPEVTTLQMPEQLMAPATVDTALEKAFDNNPRLLSANLDIESAKAQHAATKSPFLPRVTLEGDRSWNEDIDGVEGDNEDWVIALRLRYNLYNGGADTARRKQTASLVSEATEVRNTTYRQVDEGLRLAWNALEFTDRQLRYLDSYVNSINATKEAYRKQFVIGKRTLLDLLNTENELLSARRDYLNANYDRLYASYRLVQAMGNLNEVMGIK